MSKNSPPNLKKSNENIYKPKYLKECALVNEWIDKRMKNLETDQYAYGNLLCNKNWHLK